MEGFLIGVDVGGTNIKIMVMDTCYRVLGKRIVPTNAAGGYENAAQRMIAAVWDIFRGEEINDPRVLSVGMGLPGMIDRRNMRTIDLAVLKWNGFNPAKRIGEHFGAPSVIDNDASVNALGECYFGDHCTKNMILLTLGTGVGGGIIIEGRAFAGSSNLGAEVGHMTIAADGEVIFGRTGCMEAYCSGSALERNARRMMEQHPESLLWKLVEENHGIYDNALVSKGALCQDEVCMELFRQFNHYLAIGIANLMELFNPALILLGGGVSNAGNLILEPVRKNIQAIVLCKEQICPVMRASLGAEAGMYGACVMAAMERGLALPR